MCTYLVTTAAAASPPVAPSLALGLTVTEWKFSPFARCTYANALSVEVKRGCWAIPFFSRARDALTLTLFRIFNLKSKQLLHTANANIHKKHQIAQPNGKWRIITPALRCLWLCFVCPFIPHRQSSPSCREVFSFMVDLERKRDRSRGKVSGCGCVCVSLTAWCRRLWRATNDIQEIMAVPVVCRNFAVAQLSFSRRQVHIGCCQATWWGGRGRAEENNDNKKNKYNKYVTERIQQCAMPMTKKERKEYTLTLALLFGYWMWLHRHYLHLAWTVNKQRQTCGKARKHFNSKSRKMPSAKKGLHSFLCATFLTECRSRSTHTSHLSWSENVHDFIACFCVFRMNRLAHEALPFRNFSQQAERWQ